MQKETKDEQEIAIIGMACRFPAAKNYKEFWANLRDGLNSISAIPDSRWNSPERSQDLDSKPHWAGLLDDIWNFDNYYFKISPKEALQTDPQQRILLEEVIHCIEDSGLSPDILQKYKTSVFVGAMTSDFLVKGIEEDYPVDQYSCLGNYHCILANRISHLLNLKGESIAIDAACASSLVAVHKARMSLLNGESDFAIVAGINIITSPWKHDSFTAARMLSPAGQCKTFDYTADGYVPGEGAGVILLSRNDLALEQNATVYGLISGSAVNHNGASRSITAPSLGAQAEVVYEAIRQSRISPAEISYIEAHGTGTSLGDPIEIGALETVFSGSKRTDRYVGSLKTNIGHLEAAAGIAGLIKVCLMFQHGRIPASLNVTKTNPIINFSDDVFKPVTQLLPWDVKKQIAGVSSFGFGGVNAHVVLKAPEHKVLPKKTRVKEELFCLSAASESALGKLIAQWRDHLNEPTKIGTLSDICHTLLYNRTAHKYRFGGVVNQEQALKELLSKPFQKTSSQSFALILNEFPTDQDHGAAAGMLRELSPAFRKFYDANAFNISVFTMKGRRKLSGKLRKELDHFNLLLTLAQTLADTGCKLAMLTGSGLGHLASGHCAGLLSLEDSIDAIANGVSGAVRINPAGLKIPFWDKAQNRILQPFEESEHYWTELLASALPVPEIYSIYIAKFKLLYFHQKTFTNCIDRWFSSLEGCQKNIKHVLKDDTAYDTLSSKELLCLLIGIRLGMNEINERWELSCHFKDDSALPELVSYLSNGIISYQNLSEWIMNGDNEGVLKQNIIDNWDKIALDKLPFLSKNIIHQRKQSTMKVQQNVQGLVSKLPEAWTGLLFGTTKEEQLDKARTYHCATVSRPSFLALALYLWEHGTTLNWEYLLKSEGKPVSGLPSYPFDLLRFNQEDPEIDTLAEINAENRIKEYPRSAESDPGFSTGFQDYLLSLIEKAAGIPTGRITADTCFSEIGLDSAIILNVNQELSKTFGPVPATLFFQHTDLKSMLNFFHNNYKALLTEKFGIKAPGTNHLPRTALYQNGSAVKNHFNNDHSAEIAIIGMSGRYPGAENIEELWALLKAGGDSIEEIPASRWNYKDYVSEQGRNPGSVNAKWGGFLKDIDHFDPGVFGISPREASFMSPQERLFLEEAYLCLDHAGYLKKLKDRVADVNNVGVFVGASYNDYQLYTQQQAYDKNWVPANVQSYSVANKVSYHFDLRGPSLVIDTACSSSLYAIHLACDSIRNGECDAALAGGVNTSLHPSKYQMLAAYHFLSSDGRCRAFGEGGDGYVPAEGVGVVLLKSLSKALADHDPIYGLIKSTSVSHGGKTNGYTVPNPNEQSRAVAGAIEKAGLNPRNISYVEAHGTGTALGDPIEILGLTQAYQKYTDDKQYCAIGSIKSNIGHAEAAAGVAQAIKVLLQMKHKCLVPNLLHSAQLNPNIDFSQTPFYVQTKLAPWPETALPRRAGLSSFGAGGVNVHMIMEAYNGGERVKSKSEAYIIGLSADSPEQLIRQAKNLSAYIERGIGTEPFMNHFSLAELSNTLLVHRELKEVRLAFKAADLNEVLEKLNHLSFSIEPKSLIDQQMYYSGTEGLRWFRNTPGTEDQLFIDMLCETGGIAALAKLWALGAVINWCTIFPEFKDQPPVYLPPYAFRKQQTGLPLNGMATQQKQIPCNESNQDRADAGYSSATIPAETPLPEAVFLTELVNSPDSVRVGMVRTQIKDTLAKLLGHPSGKDVKGDIGFFDLGLDSSQLTSLQEDIRTCYGLELAEVTFFEYSNVNKLSVKILEDIDLSKPVQPEIPKTEIPVKRNGNAKAIQPKIEEYTLDEINDLDVSQLEDLLERETEGY